MSEERRKRQQVREKQAEPKPVGKILVIAIIALGVLTAAGLLFYRHNHRYDGFAKCLASKNVTMYGLYWCEHCAEQKEMFGASFQHVPYIECGLKGERGEQQTCKDAGVKLFPTWQFNLNRHEGVLPLTAISEQPGCT